MEKSQQLASSYQPQEFEQRIYRLWLDQRAFCPADTGQPYVIVIPPPNVTGVLHMGHGLNVVLQDTLIRYQKMQGRAVLWVPGTDHAGIATQHVVEKKLLAEGSSRKQLGREAFLQRAWQVKEEHHGVITEQLKRLGAACDWSRERFTMDAGLSRAVTQVFVQLHAEGLIYRDHYLVNWCPSCRTALADDEVEHQLVRGALYHLHYPSADGQEGISVATTRPETMFGDAAVAVHPDDPRYQHLIGKMLRLPLTDRLIPVIADSFCDPEFGSGAVKITPAHDPNDWQVGKRHQLPELNILTEEGRLNEQVPPEFVGLSVAQARPKVVKALEEGGWLRAQEKHQHQVGHCYRCNSVIEPFLSRQWFVRMTPLAEKALQASVRFYPQRWSNTYRYWLENIRDWCISRQLWWGHRIPAWYCPQGHATVAAETPHQCQCCGSEQLHQDEDVLDTWFSSWLWPLSTLGWPEKTSDLARFYPTSTLVTAYDIIFFWVARMIMAGQHFTGQEPFDSVYFTPLVRDKQGRKMSKSLGNGIDPLEIIDLHGADALKFTLVYLSHQGQDILLDRDTFKLGSRFCNKVWNAARFMLIQLTDRQLPPPEQLQPGLWDRWIEARLDHCLQAVSAAVEQFRFDDMGHAVYNFFWNELCDWYLETSKVALQQENGAQQSLSAGYLCHMLEKSLRLLHPFASFITEELYRMIPPAYRSTELLCQARYPSPRGLAFPQEESVATLQQAITSARALRSQFVIPPNQKVRLHIHLHSASLALFFSEQQALLQQLIQADPLQILSTTPTLAPEEQQQVISDAGNGFEVRMFIRHLIDQKEEQQRLQRKIDKLEQQRVATEKKLANPDFIHKAPEEVVQAEQALLQELFHNLERSRFFLAQLAG